MYYLDLIPAIQNAYYLEENGEGMRIESYKHISTKHASAHEKSIKEECRKKSKGEVCS